MLVSRFRRVLDLAGAGQITAVMKVPPQSLDMAAAVVWRKSGPNSAGCYLRGAAIAHAMSAASRRAAFLQRRKSHRQKAGAISELSLRSTASARYCMPLLVRDPGTTCRTPPRPKSLAAISGATRRHFPVMIAGRAR